MAEFHNTHEDFGQRDKLKEGSERVFGIVFAIVFLVISCFPLISEEPLRVWALLISIFFSVAVFAFPTVLKPLNIMWFRFGMLLHKIVNPLVMGLLFFLTVVPIGLIMRLIGKDPLNLRFDPDLSSYWIERDVGDPQPETMRRQF